MGAFFLIAPPSETIGDKTIPSGFSEGGDCSTTSKAVLGHKSLGISIARFPGLKGVRVRTPRIPLQY